MLMVRNWIRKRAYQSFDGFWYSGVKSREFIEEYSNLCARYVFVPNLVDNTKYENLKKQFNLINLKKKYLQEKDKKIFLIPARLTPGKGILEFLSLFSIAEGKDRAVVLIAGTGELKLSIEKKAHESNLDVVMLGYRNESEMRELYAISDFMVLPSLSDPNPLSVIEACWAALPLLVSEHVGNHPETVKNGVNGFVFSYKRCKEAVEIVERCLDCDQGWMARASLQSLQIASEIYNPKTAIPRIVKETIGSL